ncbi:MAG: flippase-like domain-containing protein [Gammaproteobacteria bacterium]|nr:flippase-like domain-containing protein [Gammaproteobacteria bacterium]MDH5653136.1 flippase-like domain-containing protein [Gammaproteobacteria bacterium]
MADGIKQALKVAVSLGCFAAVFYMINMEELLAQLRKVAVMDLLPAAGLLLFGHVANGWRFHFTINRLGRRLTAAEAIKTSFVALWFNQILPTGSGGDVVRGFMLAERCGVLRSVYAILADRVLGLSWMLLMVTIFLPLVFYQRLGHSTTVFVTVLFGLAFFATLLPVLIRKNLCRLFSLSILYRICRYVMLFGHMARLILQPATLHKFIWLLCLSFFPYVFAVAVIGNAFGLGLSLHVYIALAPILFIAMNFPVSVGGWGVRELTSIYVFSHVGMSEEVAIIISMLYGLGLIVTSVPGNLVWLKQKTA